MAGTGQKHRGQGHTWRSNVKHMYICDFLDSYSDLNCSILICTYEMFFSTMEGESCDKTSAVALRPRSHLEDYCKNMSSCPGSNSD